MTLNFSPPQRRRFLKSIRGKLVLLLCGLLISTLLIQIYIYYDRLETHRAEELQANLEIARAVSKTFETFVMDIVHSELLIGLALTSQSVTDQERDHILDEFDADNPAVRDAFWINPSGTVINCSLKDYLGLDFSDRSFYKQVVNGKTWTISELIFERATANPGFTISRGIRNTQGQLLGIVGASIEPDLLDAILGIERATGAAISLVDNRGMLVYRYPRIYPSWEERNWLKKLPQLQKTLNGVEYAWINKTVYEDRYRVMANVPIREIGWVAWAGHREEDVLASIRASLMPNSIAFLLITIAAFGTAFVFSRKISNSIGKLRNHALALGRGATQNPIDLSGTTELDDLANAFNEMTEAMQTREREREHAEQALRESLEWLRLAQSGANIGIWDWNPKTGEHNRTPELNLLYGTGPETTRTYEDWRKRVHPDDIGRFESERDEAIARHEPFNLEFRFLHSSGEIRWMSVRGSAIYDEAGETVRVLGVNLDITERKRVEEEFRELSQRLTYHVEHSPLAVIEWGPGMRLIRWSGEAEHIFGWRADEVLGRRMEDFRWIYEEDKSQVGEVSSELASASNPRRFSANRNYRKDGTVIHCEWYNSSLLDDAGRLKSILSLVLDVTQRNQAEDELRKREQEFRALVENSPDMIVRIGKDLRRIYVNPAIITTFGLTPSEFVGTMIPEDDDVSPEKQEHARVVRSACQRVFATGEQEVLEYSYPTPQGIRHFQGRLIPEYSEDGAVETILTISRDITERKQMEEDLRRSRDELEMRVQERTVALERANEELRQIPSKLIAVQEEERKRLASELHDGIGQTLAAIKFWIETILKQRDEGHPDSALTFLEQFIPILQRSIEETRSIYMGLRPSMLDSMGLLATLEWLRRECMKLYPDRHIELETGVAEDEIPENLKVNIFRIVQEALNNVAKHSKAEWVDISLSKSRDEIELVVSDDGVGMDVDLILQTSTARSLGLTSMRERAELTGGRFTIDSTSGGGTTIRACWPNLS